MESLKVNLILEFIRYHSNIELIKRVSNYLKKNGKVLNSYHFHDLFVLNKYAYKFTVAHFLDIDFLNNLPSEYLDEYLEKASSVGKSDDEIFIEKNIKSIVETVIEKQKLTNYVEEIIKIDKLNNCNRVVTEKSYDGKNNKFICNSICIGEKCLWHKEKEEICYL